MQWLQGTFAVRFNRFRDERGHLFQGRYGSLIVDPGGGLGPLWHSIHLGNLHEVSRQVSAWTRQPDPDLAARLA